MTLYINCCVREESRTDRLARAVLQKLGGNFTEFCKSSAAILRNESSIKKPSDRLTKKR